MRCQRPLLPSDASLRRPGLKIAAGKWPKDEGRLARASGSRSVAVGCRRLVQRSPGGRVFAIESQGEAFGASA